MFDREGMNRARLTCGTLMDAISAQREDLERDPRYQGVLGDLKDAANYLSDAEDTLYSVLEYTRECAVCDGIIGDSARAEVVFKDDTRDPKPHRIIHQSCFRTNDHEIA